MLRIYNTLTKSEEEFKPLEPQKAQVYQCGPTVYWTQHIGNMRAMVLADLVWRSLSYLEYDVTFVRNYTDVGHLTGDNLGDADQGVDRMQKAAEREATTPETIANRYISQFEEDIEKLNVLSPAQTPRATEYIKQMIALVGTLLENGFAYTTSQAVYFDISTKEDYTKLSGQKLDAQESGAGVGTVSDEEKRHPQDFALWFFKTGSHKEALQTWHSPFESPEVDNGEGFPGWHIECSAMIEALLGETVDIHIGGIEHISIHHTNEIAQSESAHNAPLATIWMHNEHLLVDGKKMAKSEGTAYCVSDVIERGFDPLALRYFFLGAQYRSQQNFTWEALEAAQAAYVRLIQRLREYKGEGVLLPEYRERFVAHLEDDFNVPAALAVVWEMLKDDTLSPADVYTTALSFDAVLGLRLKERAEEESVIPEDVQQLAERREEARKDKDWDKADKLRATILEKGYEVQDTDEGPFVKKLGNE